MHIITRIEKIFEKVDKLSKKRPMNLARKKFVGLFVLGLIKSRSIHFSEIASQMPNQTKSSSNHRRIQDFFANYSLDYLQLSTILYQFLPQGKYLYLSIDRSNWQFGRKDINFLVVTAYCKGVGIPLWFELLPKQKRGNSTETDRMHVLKPIITLFAKHREIVLTGDREFIGERWIGFLLKNQVKFYMRLRNNIYIAHQGEQKKASQWLGEASHCFLDNICLYGYFLSVGIQKDLKNDDPITILTNTFARQAVKQYKKRWAIEVFFQSIKKRGFRLEDTHLKDDERLRKLLAMVSLAFALCLKIGIWVDENRQQIKVKNHGYKANSFFRYGVDKIRDALEPV